MIALLIILGVLDRDDTQISKLANIHRKAINTQYKNDRDQSTLHVLHQLEQSGVQLQPLEQYANHILSQLSALSLSPLGPKTKPA